MQPRLGGNSRRGWCILGGPPESPGDDHCRQIVAPTRKLSPLRTLALYGSHCDNGQRKMSFTSVHLLGNAMLHGRNVKWLMEISPIGMSGI
jgi:hypothetical protein